MSEEKTKEESYGKCPYCGELVGASDDKIVDSIKSVNEIKGFSYKGVTVEYEAEVAHFDCWKEGVNKNE